MAQTLEIRITGNGSQAELIKALEKVVSNVKSCTPGELEFKEWEDSILMTEIWEITSEKKPNYEATEEDIENDAFNREAGYES